MIKKWMAFALILMSGSPFLFSASKSPLNGRDLPFLRNYFLRQYVETVVKLQYGSGMGLTRGDMMMMDLRVSQLVDEYLADLAGRMKVLRKDFKAGLRFRAHALDQEKAPEDRLAARVGWKRALAAIEDGAGDIRGMLRPILRGLKSKVNFKPEISDVSVDAGFREEMAFLGEQIGKADQRIRDYFFSPTHIVSVDGLRGENMMIYLYRVQKMSESLKKKVGLG
jgi:hypothetical protein